MEYLYGRNRAVAGSAEPALTAAGKHVIVVGGGDTGADCVASAHREGAASVTQIELLGEPPATRPDDVTPWPLWPAKLRTSYALEEGGDREFAISTARLSGDRRVEEIHWARNSGVPPFEPIDGTDETLPAELVLLAMGFVGTEPGLPDELGVDRDARGNIATTDYETSVPGVFAAGDARRGQSLVVWAIEEGRQCAAAVDAALRSASEQPVARLANTA
jgi:glutamate synthase (NADPH/NADH) small chain